MKIDAHQHFWFFDGDRDNWITDDMQVLRRNFLPEDLRPLLMENGITASVAIQASQAEEETDFLLSLSRKYDFIQGIVGWVNLSADNIVERLNYYSQFKKMKGFRHILQNERDRAYMLSPQFSRGIDKLSSYGFTYDILIYPDQLGFTEILVRSFPDQMFIIDHIAKPDIKNKNISDWRRALEPLGKFPNVYCKISGLVTQASWHHWSSADFEPFLNAVFEIFGSSRILFGSDWPLCNLAGGYAKYVELVSIYLQSLTETEQALVWGENAKNFYRL